jgi:DNA repair protein RadD
MQQYVGQRVLMVTHVKELIEQNFQKLVSFWPDAPVGIYSAGIGKKQPWAEIVCGGVQSMYKQAVKLGHRDLMFVDEAHLLSPQQSGMYMKLINELKEINPSLKVIGFSATPWRLKGGSLLNQENAIFTDIIYEIGIKDLVDRKYLAPLVSKSSVIQADMTGVKMTAGEFNLKQAEAAVDNNELTEAALDEIEKLAKNRKNFLFFCAGIQHAEHVKAALNKRMGWIADVITCDTPKDERARLLNQFRDARPSSITKRALVNNAVLTTGVDLPNIDCIVLLRATASSVLYIQLLGS